MTKKNMGIFTLNENIKELPKRQAAAVYNKPISVNGVLPCTYAVSN